MYYLVRKTFPFKFLPSSPSFIFLSHNVKNHDFRPPGFHHLQIVGWKKSGAHVCHSSLISFTKYMYIILPNFYFLFPCSSFFSSSRLIIFIHTFHFFHPSQIRQHIHAANIFFIVSALFFIHSYTRSHNNHSLCFYHSTFLPSCILFFIQLLEMKDFLKQSVFIICMFSLNFFTETICCMHRSTLVVAKAKLLCSFIHTEFKTSY